MKTQLKITLFILFISVITHNIGCVDKPDKKMAIQLVVVTAYNCNSCSTVEDTLQYIQRIDSSVEIKRIDIHNPEGSMYVSQYHLWRVPVYLFLDSNGMELYRLEGEQSQSEIYQALNFAKERYAHLIKKSK